MRKLTVFILMLCAVAYAEETPLDLSLSNGNEASYNQSTTQAKSRTSSDKGSFNSEIQFGGSYSYVWITPENNPTFSGSLGGAQGSYQYRPMNSLYEAVKFSWRQGLTNQGIDSRFLLDFDAHERIGYTFADDDCQWRLTLYTGAGYRYLGHKLVQPGVSDLHFNYNEIYIPVGFLVSGKVYSYVTLGLNGVWMPQVYPAVTILPLGGANWIINRTLKNFQVEFPVTFDISRCGHFNLEIKPFFQYWQDGATNAVSKFGFALDTPGNTYLFCGTEVNLGWEF